MRAPEVKAKLDRLLDEGQIAPERVHLLMAVTRYAPLCSTAEDLEKALSHWDLPAFSPAETAFTLDVMRAELERISKLTEIREFLAAEGVEGSVDGLPDEVIDLLVTAARACKRAKELSHQLVGMRNN